MNRLWCRSGGDAGESTLLLLRSAGSGYAYVEPGGGPYLLAATNRRTAADLLWETLAASDPDTLTHVGTSPLRSRGRSTWEPMHGWT